LKKRLNIELELYFESEFPKVFSKKVRNNMALIGVGGNLGSVKIRFKKLLLSLKNNPHLRVIKTAPILKNPPFGYKNQPFFLNTLLLVDTPLSPFSLLSRLLYIEKRFKRERRFKNAPRTLDLDIIFYEDKKISTKKLTIPHPFWSKRESVIIPLRYLGEIK
jgi:2-amino-4-hydroxy-6-hydroxymethyldihydropteridine diphosphokinase